MAVDIQALKTPPPDDTRAEELIAECRSRLGGKWRLLSASVKLSKAIFEAEYDGRRVIGKVSGSKRAQTAFGSLQVLRDAGLRPPSEFVVPEPIAWFDDLKLLVLEKAPGVAVTSSLQDGMDTEAYVRRAAEWLQCLQALELSLPEDHFNAEAAEKRATELINAVGGGIVEETARGVIDILRVTPSTLVPSHGDFHPMNVFVSPQRVTVIDLDTVALREPEADVGYFLAQTANFGLLIFDTLDVTRELRALFLGAFPDLDRKRLCAHVAGALLQSLHYDACILKIKNDKAGLMVRAASEVLNTGSLHLAGA
ncbi:MAG TPA: phosphotransferase [Bryobacteraceae bacterium]|nr:phosphotransferase [Bryobacteraceae bacterium]